MKLLLGFCLSALPFAAQADEIAQVPSASAAAAAYTAYHKDVCDLLIDICDSVSTAQASDVERLKCRRERSGAVCSFDAIGKSCRAHFIRSDTSDGWSVAFRTSAPRGHDVKCK